MRAFVFVSCFVALAIARPEAGYSYNPPAQAPAPSYSQPAQTSYQAAGGSSYSDSSVVGASYSVGGAGQSYSSGGAFDSGSQFVDTSANYNSGSYSSGSALGSGSAFGGGVSFDSGSGSGFGGASGGATTVVQKHIYVHVPPPEPEQTHSHHGASGVVNQKHYKIIFIKAPSAPSYSPAQIAAQQASNEEKTIVYVLVKKPEDIDAASNAFAAPPVVPSKPEVYFIKYKTQGSSGASSGGQISGGSGVVSGSHDAVSGVSFDHSASHAHGQPHQAYGPPH